MRELKDLGQIFIIVISIVLWLIISAIVSFESKDICTTFLMMYGFGIALFGWILFLHIPLKSFNKRHPGIVHSKFIVYVNSLSYFVSLDVALISFMTSLLLSPDIKFYVKFLIVVFTVIFTIILFSLSLVNERAYLVKIFEEHVYEIRNFRHQIYLKMLIKNILNKNLNDNDSYINSKKLESRNIYYRHQLATLKMQNNAPVNHENNINKSGSDIITCFRFHNFIHWILYGSRKKIIKNNMKMIENKEINEYIYDKLKSNGTKVSFNNTAIGLAMKHYADRLINNDVSKLNRKSTKYYFKSKHRSNSSCSK